MGTVGLFLVRGLWCETSLLDVLAVSQSYYKNMVISSRCVWMARGCSGLGGGIGMTWGVSSGVDDDGREVAGVESWQFREAIIRLWKHKRC